MGAAAIKRPTRGGTGRSACATEAACKAALEKLPRVPHERNRTLETEGCGTRAEKLGRGMTAFKRRRQRDPSLTLFAQDDDPGQIVRGRIFGRWERGGRSRRRGK